MRLFQLQWLRVENSGEWCDFTGELSIPAGAIHSGGVGHDLYISMSSASNHSFQRFALDYFTLRSTTDHPAAPSAPKVTAGNGHRKFQLKTEDDQALRFSSSTCLTEPIVSNSSRAGGDYANHPIVGATGTRGAELCRASCCADAACVFWGLDVSLSTPGKVHNCSHGQMCCWLKHSSGAGSVSNNSGQRGYTGTSGRQPAPPPTPPGPPALSLPTLETECMLRQLALEYAMHLQPQRDHQITHDALRLGAGCNRTFKPRLTPPPSHAAQQGGAQDLGRRAGIVVHVSPKGSDETGDGSTGAPFATLHRARDDIRVRRGSSSSSSSAMAADVVIGAGTYHFATTLELGVLDSHLRFLAAPGATVVLSGGEPLATDSWKPAGAPFPSNVYSTNVGPGKVSPRGSVGLTSLYVNGERRWRARVPNGDPRSDFPPRNMFEGPAASPRQNQLSEEQIKGLKPMPAQGGWRQTTEPPKTPAVVINIAGGTPATHLPHFGFYGDPQLTPLDNRTTQYGNVGLRNYYQQLIGGYADRFEPPIEEGPPRAWCAGEDCVLDRCNLVAGDPQWERQMCVPNGVVYPQSLLNTSHWRHWSGGGNNSNSTDASKPMLCKEPRIG
jgi:hypothetical protein